MNWDVDRPHDEAALVGAIELDDESRDGVQQHVAPERAPWIWAPFSFRHEQERQNQQLRARFVDLRRMERDVQGRADVGCRKRIGERDGPRHRRRPAVAAAGHEASDPPDHVPQRDARGEHVARRPERQFVPPDVPEGHERRRDEAAVEHAARARKHENFIGVVAEVVEIDQKEQELRADQGGDDDVHAQVEHPAESSPALRARTIASCSPRR